MSSSDQESSSDPGSRPLLLQCVQLETELMETGILSMEDYILLSIVKSAMQIAAGSMTEQAEVEKLYRAHYEFLQTLKTEKNVTKYLQSWLKKDWIQDYMHTYGIESPLYSQTEDEETSTKEN